MNDVASRLLRVRSREPSPPTPLAALLEPLHSLGGVSVSRRRKCIVLSYGEDREDLKIHVDVDPVTLPDLNFEGNPELAIRVLHVWLPMFGAVELRDHEYTQVIDDTESVEEMMRTYQAKERADMEKIRAQIDGIDRDDDRIDAPPASRASRNLGIAAIVAFAVAVTWAGLWAFRERASERDLGATCGADTNCASDECLFPDAFGTQSPSDDRLRVQAPSSFRSGRCTQTCVVDNECPASMTCRDDVVRDFRAEHIGVGHCTPRSWYRTESATR